MRWIFGLTAVAALGIWLVVAAGLHLHADQYRDDLASSLTDTNGSLAEFLVSWAGDLESTLGFVTTRSDVVEAVDEVVTSAGFDSAAAAGLAASLGPLAGDGVLIAAPDGRIVMGPDAATLEADPNLLSVIAGDPGPAFSVLPPDPTADTESGPIPVGVRLWSIVGDPSAPVGWLGIEVDVGPLVRMLRSAAGSSVSREMYVFDETGRLLTPSRFDAQLADIGLIAPDASSIGLRLLDPGHDLLTSTDAQVPADAELTRMARSAVAGGSGVDVEGYRDYRGVTAVGAWRWIDELGVGIATEVDRSEAFAPLARTSMTWAVGAAILTMLVMLLALVFGITDRRLRRTSRQLMELNDHLDEEVRARTAALEASRTGAEAESAARAELVAAVSHELRTPLTSVIGFARLLHERENELDPTLRVFVQLLLQEGEDMADLVDDLLTSVKISTRSLEVEAKQVDLIDEARAIVAGWDPAERGRIGVEGPAVPAIGDQRRIRQIVRNLVSNAVRHGGPRVRVLTSATTDEAMIVVADDGQEIPVEVREKMFDIYARGPAAEGLAPSLGIGLSICWHLADAMGGTVRFDRIDGWNRFALVLPVHAGDRVEVAA